MILSGNNTFTGGVYLNDGIIQLGNAGALNSSTANAINFGGSGMISGVGVTTPDALASAPTLALVGYSVSVASLSTANNQSGVSPIIENANGSSVANATLTFSGSGTTTFTGTVQNGTGGGTLSLVENGSGSQTLGGTLSYGGSTTVTAGTLALTATPSATPSYTVNGTLDVTGLSSGTLALIGSQSLTGSGTVNGTISTAGSTILAPGNGTTTTGGSGTLTLGNLTLAGSTVINFGLNASSANANQIRVGSGTLTLPAAGTVTLNLYSPGTSTAFAAAGTYNLFRYTTLVNGSSLDTKFSIGTSYTGYLASYDTVVVGDGTYYLRLTLTQAGVTGTWTDGDGTGNWSDALNWDIHSVPSHAKDIANLGIGASPVTLDANETVGTINLSNSGSYTISGSHTLTLDNGGYQAAVNVTAGTANVISTPISLSDSSDITSISVSSGKSLSVSGNVGGASETLTVNGAGTLALSGNNNYGPSAGTVGTTLSGGGTLQLGNNSALGSGDLSVSASSTIQAGVASLNLANNISVPSLTTATIDNNGYDVTLGGTISGGGSLSKPNAGVLTLSGANTYGGNTIVGNGTLSIGSDSNLGTPPGSATVNNLVLASGTADLVLTGNATLNATRGIGLGATSGSSGITALIDVASGQSAAINGVIQSAGNTGVNSLTVNSGTGNNGTLTLGGANLFTGATIIDNGILNLGNSLALQTSTLDYNNHGGSLSFGTLTAATLGGLSGAQDLVLDNTTPAAVTLTVGNNNASTTYSGALSGNGSLTKTGTGTLILTGNHTYTNTTLVSSGVLQLNPGGAINCGVASVADGTGQLVVNGGALTATNGTIGNSAGLLVSAGSATYTGTLSTDNNTSGSTLIAITGGTFSAAGVAMGKMLALSTQPTSGSTTSGFYVNGGTANISGDLTVNFGNNSSTSARMDSGNLNVNTITVGLNNSSRWSVMDMNGGSLVVKDTAAGIKLGNGQSGNAVFLMRGGTATVGKITLGYTGIGNMASVFDMTGGSLDLGIGGISVASTASGFVYTNYLSGGILGAAADWSSSADMILGSTTIQAADSSATAHNIALSGVLSGAGALTKTGNGTLTLSAGNTYTGNTTVNGGTLLVNNTTGSGTGSGSVAVSGGTLGGNGTISGAVTVGSASSGTLSPGSSAAAGTIGTLSFGSTLSLGSSSTVNMDINKTSGVDTADKAAVTGAVTYNGMLNVTATGDTLASGDSFTLFTGSGFSGWFSTVSLPALPTGLTWDTNDLATSGVLDVYTFTTTPLTVATLINTTATIPAAKLANHSSSAKAASLYPTGWTATASGNTLGSVSFNGNSDLIYTANGTAGTDNFTVTLHDGHGAQTVAVTVTVSTANVGPQLSLNNGYLSNGGFASFTAVNGG